MAAPPASSLDTAVPSWLNRLAAIGWRVLVTVALGILIVGLAIYLSTVTLSILFGVIALATLGPLRDRLEGRGWGHAKASAGALGIGLLLVGAAVVLVVLAVVPALVDLAKAAQQGTEGLEAWLTSVGAPPEYAALLGRVVEQVSKWLADQAASIVGSLAQVATIVMLGLFLTFYFLLDGDKGWDVGLRDLRPWRRDRIRAAGMEAMQRAGGYVRGTAAIAAADAVGSFVALTLLGVPLAGPLAVVVLIAGFVPYIGGVFASGVVLLVGFASGGWPTALVLLGLIVVMNLLEHRFLAGSVYGRTLDLHPAIIVVAVLIGATLGGIVGMFVAVPTVAVLVTVTGAVLAALGERDADEETISASIPDWLDRLAQWSWRLLVGGAFVYLGVLIAAQIPVVIGPIVVAITLAATFQPATKSLEARGWSRERASLVISVALWTIVVVVTVLSLAAMSGPAQQAVQAAVQGASKADSSMPEPVAGALGRIAEGFGSGILGVMLTVTAEIAAAVIFMVLSALLSFFLLRDGDKAWAWITGQIHGWRRSEVEVAGETAVRMLGGYMIATGALALFNGITGWVIMTLLGLPLALPIAILSFFGGFIPYIGQAITSLLGFLVAIAFGTTQDIIFMAIWTAVFNVVQGSVIAPLVYGRAVSLHPAIVLIAIPAGGALAGVLGMFLAVPLVGIAGAVWRHVLAAIGEIPPPVASAASGPDASNPVIDAASPAADVSDPAGSPA